MSDHPSAAKRVILARGASSEAVDHRTVVGRHRRASTRARIVEAAALVYAEKGLDAPVIDDFVKAAGMSRGTFYNHFTTTAELLEATIELFANNLDRAIRNVVHEYPDVVEKTAIAMRIHLYWITSDPALCAFFARVPRVSDAGRREARAYLSQGMKSGLFDVPHIDAACDLVFGVITETVHRVAKSPGKPKRCNEVIVMVLVALGVDRERIRQVMAIPLPQFEPPLMPKEALVEASVRPRRAIGLSPVA